MWRHQGMTSRLDIFENIVRFETSDDHVIVFFIEPFYFAKNTSILMENYSSAHTG